jgi:hypothetical protein
MKVWQSSFYDAPEQERSRRLTELKHKSSVELVEWLRSDSGNSQESPTRRDARHTVSARESGAFRMGVPSVQRLCDGSMSIGISDYLMVGLRPPPRRRNFISIDSKKMEHEVRHDHGDNFDHCPEGRVQTKTANCGENERNIMGKPSPRVAKSVSSFNRVPPQTSVLKSESYQAVKYSPRIRVGAGLHQNSFDDNKAALRTQPGHIIGLPKINEDILTAHASKSGQSPRLSYHDGSKARSNCFAIDSSNKRSLVIHDGV